MADEINDLMSELRGWEEQAEYGEQSELARLLGVPKQRVNHWIACRKIPNLRDGLKLQGFLKKQRRATGRRPALRLESQKMIVQGSS
jgi:predicted XRE-type DNA-binding protein